MFSKLTEKISEFHEKLQSSDFLNRIRILHRRDERKMFLQNFKTHFRVYVFHPYLN